MRRSPTTDPAVRELQDEASGRSGRNLTSRCRVIEGDDEGIPAVLVQWFTGGRVWKTIYALRSDGTTRQVP